MTLPTLFSGYQRFQKNFHEFDAAVKLVRPVLGSRGGLTAAQDWMPFSFSSPENFETIDTHGSVLRGRSAEPVNNKLSVNLLDVIQFDTAPAPPPGLASVLPSKAHLATQMREQPKAAEAKLSHTRHSRLSFCDGPSEQLDPSHAAEGLKEDEEENGHEEQEEEKERLGNDVPRIQQLHELQLYGQQRLEAQWLLEWHFEQLLNLECRFSEQHRSSTNGLVAPTAALGPAVVPPPNRHGIFKPPTFLESRDTVASNQTARSGKVTSKICFPGFSIDLHKDFELVPRLIGRGGANLRFIAQLCHGAVRVRGEGSGHKDKQATQHGRPEPEPLHVLLFSPDAASHEVGKHELLKLFNGIHAHFDRYLKKKGLPVPQEFYFVQEEL